MPKLYMLTGFPGAGKSSFIAEFFSEFKERPILLSTDFYIEKWAKNARLTYDEVFEYSIKSAEKTMMEDLERALKQGHSIIWDQTNLTKKTRAKKLAKIPADYERIAIAVHTKDFKTLASRLNSRPGKTIPKHVIWSMMESYQPPEYDEGFSKIFEISC